MLKSLNAKVVVNTTDVSAEGLTAIVGGCASCHPGHRPSRPTSLAVEAIVPPPIELALKSRG